MAGPDQSAFNLADPAAQRVLQALRAEIAICTGFRFLGPPVLVNFALAATTIEVLHGVGQVPTARHVLLGDCLIVDAPGKQWTYELAYLQSDRPNSYAVVQFGMLREDAFNVQSTG